MWTWGRRTDLRCCSVTMPKGPGQRGVHVVAWAASELVVGVVVAPLGVVVVVGPDGARRHSLAACQKVLVIAQ